MSDFFIGLVMGAVLVFWLGGTIMGIKNSNLTRELRNAESEILLLKKNAVERHVATWEVDVATGNTTFTWNEQPVE